VGVASSPANAWPSVESLTDIGVVGSRSLSLILFIVLMFLSRSLTIIFVVCNLCYEGSLVAVSCNSLSLTEIRVYPIREKSIYYVEKMGQTNIKGLFMCVHI